jgi:hypothetical protein
LYYQNETIMKNQNVAQFRLSERFTLSLSDLGEDHGGFEPMLIDFDSRDKNALERDGKFVNFINLNNNVFRVWSVDDLETVIKDAKVIANEIVREEVLQDNKELFV